MKNLQPLFINVTYLGLEHCHFKFVLQKLRNVIQAHKGFTVYLLTSFKRSPNAPYSSSKLGLETPDSFQKESIKFDGFALRKNSKIPGTGKTHDPLFWLRLSRTTF